MDNERIRVTLETGLYKEMMHFLELKVKINDMLRENKNDNYYKKEENDDIVKLYNTLLQYKKTDIVDGVELVSCYLYPVRITSLIKYLMDVSYSLKKNNLSFEELEKFEVENPTVMDEIDYKMLYEKKKKEKELLEEEYRKFKEKIASFGGE